ncbi:methyltransferase domain-containing protein [Poronia punctata]|nr:methyltransferase domain-containing protein [Poronia punctata]
MATFARPTFSAKAYAAFRPTYPASLYRKLLDYHQGSEKTMLVDMGCGHGLVARALSPHFRHVLAIDPSAGMIEQAAGSSSNNTNLTFRQARAEELSSLVRPGTVDVAVAAQAAHWFDQTVVWRELARAIRPGGTVAFWGYKDNVLVGFEQATAIMEEFVYGFGRVAPGIEGMGGYWEQPGRNILRDLLRSVVVPEEDWRDVVRFEHEPGEEGDGDQQGWLRREMKLGQVEAYTRTFSSYSGWKDAHPEIKSRAEGGSGDVLDVMWDRMVDAVPAWKALGEKWREAEVVNDWGTFIIMARRR